MNSKIYNSNDSLNLKVFLILNRCAYSVNRNIHPIFKAQGITESQFFVLEYLYHVGDSRIKDIIEKTFSSGGTMTVIIDNLEKRQLIERKKDPNDRRAYLINITKKGTELIENIFNLHVENLDTVFSVLSEEEKKEMIKFLKKLGKSQ